MAFLVENKRSISNYFLFGLTVGGYAIVSVALYCFGGGLTASNQMPAGNVQMFLFMIPGLIVGLLDFAQIHADEYLQYKPRALVTWIALWLNAIAIVSLCAMIGLKGIFDEGRLALFVPLSLGILAVASFLFGIVASVLNVVCILIIARSGLALVALVACLLPALWPAHRAGLFTKDAGRYATRQDRTIYLHPSDVSFQIPQDWLTWNAEFHNNFHLTHRDLRKVRFGSGEWDYEYGEVVNSALPFEYCAAHLGGEGWGTEGVSFGDLQMRVYVAEMDSEEIFKRISGPALLTAKKVSSGFSPGSGEVSTDHGEEGPWRWAAIRYSLFYGDYGGTANVEFYVRPVYKYQLVLVFMGKNEKEKQVILKSVTLARPPEAK